MNEERKYLTLPDAVLQRDGPFTEFKQDAAFVSVELQDGRFFHHLLIVYPNYIVALKDHATLPFRLAEIVRAFQTKEDRKLRSTVGWTFWPYPGYPRSQAGA